MALIHTGSLGEQSACCPQHSGAPLICWGNPDPEKRGPIVGTTTNWTHRNVIGAHSPYSLLKGFATSVGMLDKHFIPNLSGTEPMVKIGPYPQWSEPDKIVTLDAFGAMDAGRYDSYRASGYNLFPTIAIHSGKIRLLEVVAAKMNGYLKPDEKILFDNGDVAVTKIPIDSVWYLPGIAKRLGVDEMGLRRAMYEQSGGMYEHLVSRPDLKVFLPPIPNATILVFGDPAKLADPTVKLTARLHDQCTSSDVFGSEKCSCRSFLMFAIIECIRAALEGGVGLIVYCYCEGRCHGEVPKTMVYNHRDRDGDDVKKYFWYTEQVTGVGDLRFQTFKSDPLNWLGVRLIHNLISASSEKYAGITGAGIEVLRQVPIPNHLLTAGALNEVSAKEMLKKYAPRGQPN